MPQPEFRYWAFISYSHQDKAWGDWLHRKLETYRVPRRLVGQPHWSGTIPRRLFPIFRDRDELPSSADLGSALTDALRRSRCQIVICSPRAAQSRWVNEEIKLFKAHGREHHLLALIVDGEPRVGSERECFPPSLRFKSDARGELTDERTEIIAADAREGRDGREDALLKLIAGILGLSFDDLKQRERRRRFWKRVQYAAVAALAFAAALGSWRWFEHYKETQALDAHVEKVYDLGRRELLDHHEARAAVYLNEAYRLGRDTPALRFMLGQAMQAIDPLEDVHIETGGPVRRPAFAPDSRSFITPTETKDGVIAQIWETSTGKQLARLQGLPNAPLVTKFLPDGKRVLVSGFMEEQLEETRGTGAFTGIWDTSSGEQLMRFEGHTGRFGQPIDASGRWLVTADATDSKPARIWDLQSGKVLHALDAATRVLAASLSPDGKLAVTGDRSGDAALWDVASGRQLRVLPGHMASHIVGTLFTSDNHRVLAFGARGDVRIWDVETGALLLGFAGDSAGFNDIVLLADGSRLVTIGQEGYKVWDTERGILILSRAEDLPNWSSAALSPDGLMLVTADGIQPSAEVFHVPSRTMMMRLERGGTISAATFSGDGRRLLLASSAGVVELWAQPSLYRMRSEHERRNGRASSLYATRFIADDKQIVTASYDGSLRLWDAESGTQLRRVDESSALIDAMPSPDGARLIDLTADGHLQLRAPADLSLIASLTVPPLWTGDPLMFSDDGQLFTTLQDFVAPTQTHLDVWRSRDGTRAARLPVDCVVSAARFLHDGSIASGCTDGTTQLWNAETGARIRTLQGGTARVYQFAQSGDGRSLAMIGIDDPQVRLWNLSTEAAPSVISMPPLTTPASIAIDQHGDRLAMGMSTGEVLIHDVATKATRAIGAHSKVVQRLAFLPNQLLLSWRSDSTAKLWDPVAGELLGNVALHDWFVWSAMLDRTGKRLLTGGIDGVAAIWNAGPEARTPDAITARLRCRAPWRLEGETLSTADCPGAVAAPGR